MITSSRALTGRSGCCAEEAERNAAPLARSGLACAREPSPTKAGIAEVGELVEGRNDGGKVVAGVVVARARRGVVFD